MEEQQGEYAPQGYDGRGDGRERVDEYQHHQQHPHSHQHIHQPQQSIQQQAPYNAQQQQQPGSPPPSASPFAFAPPPLSSHSHQNGHINGQGQGQGPSRPVLPLHHSEPPPHQPSQYHQQQYASKPPLAPHHHSYPSYPGSASLGYRSFSGESSRQSPSQAHLPRPAGMAMTPSTSTSPAIAPQQSPAVSSPYTYQRQPSYGGQTAMVPPSPHQITQSSPQRTNMYPPNYYASPYSQPPPPGQPAPGPPGVPGAAEMPRSLSYPSNAHHLHPYQPAYHPYVPMSNILSAGMPHHPGLPPPLNRNHTTSHISNGMAGMDLGRPTPSLGYSFANRLPLVDRPFKCNECVQSFNRNHDLKRHKRIHLSVKPFGCDKCGKTFSRKDALRRHWLVKGCRGEEGATAPIVPLFPINSTPALSPPSPSSNSSPIDGIPPHSFNTGNMGFNHPSAPPPLTSLPSRQPSSQSQIIITPNDPVSSGEVAIAAPLEEPLAVDPAFNNMMSGSARGSGSSHGDGYFEGVVGLKSDGTAVLEKTQNGGGGTSPYHPTMGQAVSHPPFHHPYRRTSNLTSPHPTASPTATHFNNARPYTPSTLGPDGKPVFAMPFARQDYGQVQHDGMLAPPFENVKMEKQLSQMSQASVDADYQGAAPRWHRPSFPFPIPSGNVYNPNFDSSSPIDATAPQHAILAQGYRQ